MNSRSIEPERLRQLTLLLLIVGTFLVPAALAAADKVPVLSVRVGSDRLVVIAVRSGEIKLDGTFETRSGHSLVFAAGKLVKATDAGKRSRRVDEVSLDRSGKLVIASGKDDWKVEEGEYVKQGGDPRPQPDPDPEPQPRPNPNSFKVEKGWVVELGYK